VEMVAGRIIGNDRLRAAPDQEEPQLIAILRSIAAAQTAWRQRFE
jgi:hypothetical protein